MVLLFQAHLQINDLFTDLADGKMLMKLLEIISGESLGRPNKGVLRVQKIENVNRCINFLKTKVRTPDDSGVKIVHDSPGQDTSLSMTPRRPGESCLVRYPGMGVGGGARC